MGREEKTRPTLRSIQFCDGTRFIILVLATICLTMCIGNPLAFNFTVICMNRQTEINGTLEEVPLFTNTERDLLFLAVAVGAILGALPVTKLVEWMGLRNTLTLYAMLAAVGTILLPASISVGFWGVAVMRVCQGVAQGIAFPATGSITQQWSTLAQSSTFIAILSCHMQLGSIVMMPLGGVFCVSSLGWPALYYIIGGFSILINAAFFYFYKDEPHKHRHVSDRELSQISLNKGNTSSRRHVPYRAVCTDPTILAVWFCMLGSSWAFQIFRQYGPVYLHDVLHFNVASTGLATALPYIIAVVVKAVAGPLSDLAHCVSERIKCIIFAAVSQGIMAICIAVLALLPPSMSYVGQLCFTLTIVFSGLNVMGAVKCAQLVAREHVHFVMAVTSMLSCVTQLIIPLLISFVVPESTASQWSVLFLVSAAFLIIANIPFMIKAHTRPASWTQAARSVAAVSDPKPTMLNVEAKLSTVRADSVT